MAGANIKLKRYMTLASYLKGWCFRSIPRNIRAN
jgi:hypothetical protein